jgi:hypothetical protein
MDGMTQLLSKIEVSDFEGFQAFLVFALRF